MTGRASCQWPMPAPAPMAASFSSPMYRPLGWMANIQFSSTKALHLLNKSFYNFDIIDEQPIIIDWFLMVKKILSDISDKVNAEIISTKFHNTLVNIILKIAQKTGIKKVILSGGCFQNAVLLEKSIDILNKYGFKVYRHQRIPPNDGGISLGQVVIANQKTKNT